MGASERLVETNGYILSSDGLPYFEAGTTIGVGGLASSMKQLQPHKWLEYMGDKVPGKTASEEWALQYLSAALLPTKRQGTMPGKALDTVLFEFSDKQWHDSNFSENTRALYAVAGMPEKGCAARNDITESGDHQGTVITPGVVASRQFYFIERTINYGISNEPTRQLSVVSSNHPDLLMTANEYSYKERLAVEHYLDQVGASPIEQEVVLDAANRLTAPNSSALNDLLLLSRSTSQQSQRTLMGAVRWLGFGGLQATREDLTDDSPEDY